VRRRTQPGMCARGRTDFLIWRTVRIFGAAVLPTIGIAPPCSGRYRTAGVGLAAIGLAARASWRQPVPADAQCIGGLPPKATMSFTVWALIVGAIMITMALLGTLELISNSLQEHRDAGELDEAEEVFSVVLPANQYAGVKNFEAWLRPWGTVTKFAVLTGAGA